MIATFLAALNAVLGLLLAVFALRYARQATAAAVWLKWLHVMCGLYWCGLYTFVAIFPAGYIEPVWFGQTFVRPAFTLTLAIMASGAVYRWRSK
jgi:hypothetical protein